MNCPAKHTIFQPNDSQWRCPKCGAGNESFYIEEPATDKLDECEKLHKKDELGCKCGYVASGESFSKEIMAAQNRIVCPHCKGEGTVNP